ncbi:hypothetical protein EJ05DRAFT_272874 [Pseudovirgaria hyperparasitica]|uniref:Uncharacterized protein n=1 Tax=Pseudovirgaria hyperparasitica TaxID=470096 RepID=A0A6A6WBZ9_9PEZI|nr:uncharacterized protein EJ05DRAFT_272874 [Pseudovirgaria hyperparasitica]KAF2760105.1 hypothetical protein EJ05DRAFT_272874 [Pseudovirgaria hyperparasitica]
MNDSKNSGDEPVFRVSKRRKLIHKRHVGHDVDTHPVANVLSAPSSPSRTVQDQESDTKLSMAEVIRLRRNTKARRAGVEFSNAAKNTVSEHTSQPEVSASSTEMLDNVKGVLDSASARFAPQTGQIVDSLDLHMVAYIDSKMAELQHISQSSGCESTRHADDHHPAVHAPVKERQAAGIGKLQEVDLGPRSTQANIERTEELRRRLQAPDTPVQPPPISKPPRINPRTGKPFRPKHARRTSTDIARDALVDQVLHESRIQMYDEGAISARDNADDADGAADERIAAQFQREFMDALQTRKDKKPPPPPVGRGPKLEKEVKGPKMGGSRSARAAMKAAQDKKK